MGALGAPGCLLATQIAIWGLALGSFEHVFVLDLCYEITKYLYMSLNVFMHVAFPSLEMLTIL